jgi:hypothetical protein
MPRSTNRSHLGYQSRLHRDITTDIATREHFHATSTYISASLIDSPKECVCKSGLPVLSMLPLGGGKMQGFCKLCKPQRRK